MGKQLQNLAKSSTPSDEPKNNTAIQTDTTRPINRSIQTDTPKKNNQATETDYEYNMQELNENDEDFLQRRLINNLNNNPEVNESLNKSLINTPKSEPLKKASPNINSAQKTPKSELPKNNLVVSPNINPESPKRSRLIDISHLDTTPLSVNSVSTAHKPITTPFYGLTNEDIYDENTDSSNLNDDLDLTEPVNIPNQSKIARKNKL